MRHKMHQGFTLIETLIAAFIFGVVLTVVIQLTSSQSKVNNMILSYSDLTSDARLAYIRMNELLSQAAYIYPDTQAITLPSGSVTTGKSALAFLLASGTPYCSATAKNYCAVIYRVEARSGYTAILGDSSTASPSVITESVYTSLAWDRSQGGLLPSRNWSALTLVGGAAGLVADSVDSATTDLGTALTVSARGSDYDTGLQINVADTVASALIQAATPNIALKLADGRTVTRQFSVFAQPVPRQGPLDN